MHAEQPERHLVHESRMVVRWGDMDFYGHVNNTVYFRFFEQARVEWLEDMGFAVSPQTDAGPVIIQADCTFLRPVTYPATVLIRLYAGAPGRSSVMNWYTLHVEGDTQPYAEGAAKLVWMDMRRGGSAPLPQKLRDVLAAPPASKAAR